MSRAASTHTKPYSEAGPRRRNYFDSKSTLRFEVMTLDELAAYLNVSRSTVYRGVRLGQLPAFKVGRHWRVNLELVEDHLIRSFERKAGRN